VTKVQDLTELVERQGEYNECGNYKQALMWRGVNIRRVGAYGSRKRWEAERRVWACSERRGVNRIPQGGDGYRSRMDVG